MTEVFPITIKITANSVVIAFALIFAITGLYWVIKKQAKNFAEAADKKAKPATPTARAQSVTSKPPPYNLDSVLKMVSEITGSQGSDQIEKALAAPEQMTAYEIFEFGRLSERLCNYAASLPENRERDESGVRYFTHCRNFMHAFQRQLVVRKILGAVANSS